MSALEQLEKQRLDPAHTISNKVLLDAVLQLALRVEQLEQGFEYADAPVLEDYAEPAGAAA